MPPAAPASASLAHVVVLDGPIVVSPELNLYQVTVAEKTDDESASDYCHCAQKDCNAKFEFPKIENLRVRYPNAPARFFDLIASGKVEESDAEFSRFINLVKTDFKFCAEHDACVYCGNRRLIVFKNGEYVRTECCKKCKCSVQGCVERKYYSSSKQMWYSYCENHACDRCVMHLKNKNSQFCSKCVCRFSNVDGEQLCNRRIMGGQKKGVGVNLCGFHMCAKCVAAPRNFSVASQLDRILCFDCQGSFVVKLAEGVLDFDANNFEANNADDAKKVCFVKRVFE